MAVQPWEIQPEPTQPRPALLVAVPPPSRSGHPIAATLLVLALIAALGIPIANSSRSAPGSTARTRPLPVLALPTLDRVSPMPPGDRPRSTDVVGGVAFVSCTNLWIAHPDGTHERKLLEMPGLSSPAFAPSGRTIAFVHPGPLGDEIWMTAADGSDVRPIATLTFHGYSVNAHATGLAWSSDGNLAFALVDDNDPWLDGSSIFKLDLSTGEFHKVGAGFPTPLWIKDSLKFPVTTNGKYYIKGTRYEKWTRSPDGEEDTPLLGAAVAPSTWFTNYRHGVVVLREQDAGVKLVVKDLWRKKSRFTYGPPAGHDFVVDGQPSISQDGTKAFVDVVDGEGERDLGVLDVMTGNWDVIDYAWESTISPAPSTSGPLTVSKAQTILESLGSGLGNPNKLRLLGIDPSEIPVPQGRHAAFTYLRPTRADGAFNTTATILNWDMKPHAWRFMQMNVSLDKRDAQVVADISGATEWAPIVTPADAFDFVDAVIGHPVVRPALPPELKLSMDSPVNAWTWSGRTTVNVTFTSPSSPKRAAIYGSANTNISYGDDVSLSMGCGGQNDPEPIDIGGPEAMYDHLKPTRAIVWPATPKQTATGNFGVSSDLSREAVEAIARSMVAP